MLLATQASSCRHVEALGQPSTNIRNSPYDTLAGAEKFEFLRLRLEPCLDNCRFVAKNAPELVVLPVFGRFYWPKCFGLRRSARLSPLRRSKALFAVRIHCLGREVSVGTL